MLKSSVPSRLRRNAGTFIVCALAAVIACSVYAASAPAAVPTGGASVYQLNMDLTLSRRVGDASHIQQVNVKPVMCVKPGKTGSVVIGDSKNRGTPVPEFEVTPISEKDGQLRIETVIRDNGKLVAKPQLLVALGKAAHVEGGGYSLDLRAIAGCPAHNASAER